MCISRITNCCVCSEFCTCQLTSRRAARACCNKNIPQTNLRCQSEIHAPNSATFPPKNHQNTLQTITTVHSAAPPTKSQYFQTRGSPRTRIRKMSTKSEKVYAPQRERKLIDVRVIKMAEHPRSNPNLLGYRKNPKCDHTVLGNLRNQLKGEVW